MFGILVAAGTTLHACASVPIANVIEGRGCPTVMAHHEGGLGVEQESGMLIAVWPDGRVIRERWPRHPWGGYVAGWLSDTDRAVVAALIEDAKAWRAPSGYVGLDISDDSLTLQRDGVDTTWWEAADTQSAPALERTIEALLRLRVASRQRLREEEVGALCPSK